MILVVSGWRGPLLSSQLAEVGGKILATVEAAKKMGRYVCMVHGGASGVDATARTVAAGEQLECEEFRADWQSYGKEAGPRRNFEMLAWAHSEARNADDDGEVLLLAFPHPTKSKGTLDCIKQAIRLGIPVHVYPLARE